MGNDGSDNERQPIAVAMGWVSKITTVALEMVLPGIGGQWLDERWGTNFLALLGFALGLTVGLMHLIQMTKRFGPQGAKTSSKTDADHDDRNDSEGTQP